MNNMPGKREAAMEKTAATNDSKFVWDVKEFKRRNRKNVFQRGLKSYGFMVLVVLIFSFIGAVSFLASNYVRAFDRLFKLGTEDYSQVEAVGDYIASLPVIKDTPDFLRTEIRQLGINLAQNNRDVLSILAWNRSYMERNKGEVVGILIIAMLLVTVGSFLIRRTLIVGQKRFYMERRFKEDVHLRRVIAPFGPRTFIRVLRTMITYYICMGLWFLTVIGGIYKLFEYYFVPFIVAENPYVTWKEARQLSSAMTKGYKLKILMMHVSCLPYYLVSLIPLGDLLITAPYMENIKTEAYFGLRSRPDIDRSLFVEKAFDQKAYVDRLECGEKPEDINVEFKLEDFEITGSSFDLNDKYGFLDVIMMFFLFSFVGWLWEVSLHFYNYHVFVNRGFMHGPWLPIYGAGGALIIVLLSKYKENKPKLFIMTILLCGTLEYLTSFALDYFKNAQYWDYKGMFMNLNGRICLAGLMAFALGGFVGVYIIGPFVKRMLELLGKKKTRIVCLILVAAFAVDLAFCIIKGPNVGEGVGSQLESGAQSET
jgi:uncharacterized membrane protein